MKRTLVVIMVLCLGGCTGQNYKDAAIEYLKSKADNPGSISIVKFFKPDSIYTSFYDTKVYYNLKFKSDSLLQENNAKEAAKLTAILEREIKSYPKKIVGWDVRLIYKAKDKKGLVKTDTCRFTFSSDLSKIKSVNGIALTQD
jgi:hypothetical protein